MMIVFQDPIDKWSCCSNSDFANLYNGLTTFCLSPHDGTGPNITTPTTPLTTPTTPTTVPNNCGPSDYYGPSGMISSPNYPGNYPNNSNCEYHIFCESTQHINITFNSFEVEYEANCT